MAWNLIPLTVFVVSILFLHHLNASRKSYLSAMLIVFFTWLISISPQLIALLVDSLDSSSSHEGLVQGLKSYLIVPAETFVYVSAIFAPIVLLLIKDLIKNIFRPGQRFTVVHLSWYLFNCIVVIGCFAVSIVLFILYKIEAFDVNEELANSYSLALYLTCLVGWYCATAYLEMDSDTGDGKVAEIMAGLEEGE